MDWLYYLILLLVLAAGVFLTLLTLPGIWLMVAGAAVYALVAKSPHLGLWTLATMAGLALAAEVIETLWAGRAARASGGSRRAGIGAVVGGLIGAVFFSIPAPVIGTILGACLGVFVGAMAMEFTKHNAAGKSAKVGFAAARGKLYGSLAKVVIALVVLLMGVVAGWPR
jgi:uncharacterized protein